MKQAIQPFYTPLLRLIFLGLGFLALNGCGIPQWQRELLSDPLMMEAEPMPGTNDGMLPYREGSSGAEGEISGGCGC